MCAAVALLPALGAASAARGQAVEPPVVRPTHPTLEERGLEDSGSGGRDEIGEEVGSEVAAFSAALLFAVALVVGLGALVRRDLAQTLVIVFVVLVVGGFVLAPTAVRRLIDDIADSVSPGSGRETQSQPRPLPRNGPF